MSHRRMTEGDKRELPETNKPDMTLEEAYRIVIDALDNDGKLIDGAIDRYLNETATRECITAITAQLRVLEQLTIDGAANLLLFEQMIDALLDNQLIVTAIRMKQRPEEYE